jgi:hypothetical protein
LSSVTFANFLAKQLEEDEITMVSNTDHLHRVRERKQGGRSLPLEQPGAPSGA